MRIFAHITRDPDLLAPSPPTKTSTTDRPPIFEIPAGDPITGDSAAKAKTVNFAVIYGVSSFRLAVELGIAQPAPPKSLKAYLEHYPGVRAYLDQTLDVAHEKGHAGRLGRRRYVPT